MSLTFNSIPKFVTQQVGPAFAQGFRFLVTHQPENRAGRYAVNTARALYLVGILFDLGVSVKTAYDTGQANLKDKASRPFIVPLVKDTIKSFNGITGLKRAGDIALTVFVLHIFKPGYRW